MTLNAEYGVIGSILQDQNCLEDVRKEVTVGDFQMEESKAIFQACCDAADSNQSYDIMIIANLPGINTQYVEQLMDITPTSAYAVKYAKQVHEKGLRQGCIDIGAELTNIPDDMTYQEAAENAISKLEKLLQGSSSGVIDNVTSLMKYMDWVTKRVTGAIKPIATDVPGIDRMLSGGLENGGLYILGARPGVGKSSTGLTISDHMARKHRVLYVTMEMPDEQLNSRRIANAAGMPIAAAMGMFEESSQRHWDAIGTAMSDLSENKLFYNTSTSCTVSDIRAMARTCKAEVIVVDYLGLITASGKFSSQYERVTWLSGQLKHLALSLNVPILAMSQLNRNAANQKPTLDNLRDSGAIEQDADAVILLHRPDMDTEEKWQELQFIIEKNRNGATGEISVLWNGATGRIRDDKECWKSWEQKPTK